MNAITGALCAGRAPLFEATDTASHAEAKAICNGDLERGGTNPPCPARRACLELLHGEPMRFGTPSGTWAGILVGSKKERRGQPKPREHGTDRGYYQHRHLKEDACAKCLEAHRFEVWLRKRYGASA